jgi:hypothetical protein
MQAVVPSLLAAAEAPPAQAAVCGDCSRRHEHGVEPDRPRRPQRWRPALAGRRGCPRRSCFIFVDSGLPATTGETSLAPPQFLEQLRSRPVDGRLPPGRPGGGEDSMTELVPDEATRAALVGELPSLPLSYFERDAPSPAGWERVPSGYLLFSDAYRDAAAEARERGWPAEEIGGAQHLHMVVAPKAVADAHLRLAADWRRSATRCLNRTSTSVSGASHDARLAYQGSSERRRNR